MACWLGFSGCATDDDGTGATTESTRGDTSDSTTAAPTPVSYAACDDPDLGCDEADCRRRTDAEGSWSVCVAPCTEDADCPIVGAGNVSPVCDATGRCSLECVPQVLTCASGTRCIDGEPPQCMWPDA